MSFHFHFQHGLLPLLTTLSSDPNINTILFANAAAIIAATAELPLLLQALLLHCHCRFVVFYFKIFTVASIAYANKTLLSLLQLLPCQAAIIAACHHYHCGEKNVSQQYCIYLFYFASSMMIASLMAKAKATTTVMAAAMIYHCLFYDSNKRIVAIIYFSC